MDVEYIEAVRRRLYYSVDSVVCRVDRSVSKRYILFLFSVLFKAYRAGRRGEVACGHLEPVELVAVCFILINDIRVMGHNGLEIGVGDVLFLVADYLELLKAPVELFLAQNESEFLEPLPYSVAA